MSEILVVEDEPIVAKDIRSGLQRRGYHVCGTAASGSEAVRKVSETRPDLVLMDMRLEGPADGVETAQRIHENFDVPVVYLTAYMDDLTLKRAKATNPYGYVLKPFDERELQSTIEMALYRHKMESLLRENGQWLDATLKSIGDAVVTTDAHGVVTFLNAAAETLTGWSQSEVFGMNSDSVLKVRGEGETDGRNPVWQALESDKTVGLNKNTVLVAKNGLEIPISASMSSIKNSHGAVAGAVLVLRDISRHKLSEQILRQANDELKRLNEIKESFTAVVSHELKTPLTAITEGIQIVLQGIEGPISEGQKEVLGIVDANVARLGRLISNVLNHSRFTSGKMELLLRPVDMNGLTEEVYQLMLPIAQKYDLDFRLENPDHGIVGICDSDQIKQVLINLLDNAVKFTPRGGSVALTLRDSDGEIRLTVRDNGTGIDKADQDKIFRMFEQVRKDEDCRGGGVGIGLAVCKGIMIAHGGSILLESSPGNGAAFTAILPRREV